MPQIISAYGRDYEFPDSMSDDAIRAAIQRDKPSVADTARARLSDRGLTPEAVKAGQGITSPSEIQFAPSKSVNGGFIGGLVSNPLAGVVDSVKEKIAAGHGPLVPLEMAAELTIPNIPAIAKESYRRGEANESTADMYGQVAQGAALAAGPKVLGKMAPTRAKAVAQYAKVIDPKGENPSLAMEMAERLIDEGVKMADPRKELAGYAENELNTKLNPALDSAISSMPNDVNTANVVAGIEKGRKGQFLDVNGQPVPNGPDAPTVLSHLDDYTGNVGAAGPSGGITPQNARTLRQNYDTIYDKRNPNATPKDQAKAIVGDALRDELNKDPNVAAANADVSRMLNVKKMAGKATQGKEFTAGMTAQVVTGSAATALAALIGGPVAAKIVGGLLATGKTGHAVRIITQHPLWNTTSAVMKDRFAKAVQAGNVGEIADIAGKLTGVSALMDDYGHDDAVAGLVNSDADPQTRFDKQAYYIQPDGTRVPIPEPVTRAFLHGVSKRQ